MKKLNIGGVPEHFNLPWIDVLDGAGPAAAGCRWVAEPQGTGAMVTALGSGALDAALLLTEGAVTAAAGGADFEIVSVYVKSPLEWGIHVPAQSPFADEASIAGARIAISRYGSGSHLMSFAHARAQGWPLDALNCVVVGTIEGAREAFANDRADVFFWERVMTQPLVDAGHFRRVGVFVAPWPAFVLCISRRVSAAGCARIEGLFTEVLRAAQVFKSDVDGSSTRIADEFGIDRELAAQWLVRTQWSTQPELDKGMLCRVAEVLLEAKLITSIPSF